MTARSKACIAALPPSVALLADKGYDSQNLREWLDDRGTKAVNPPRRNRKIQSEGGGGRRRHAVRLAAVEAL